jgi:hypothetical protein
MKSLLGVCLAYDHAFSWATIIITCVVVVFCLVHHINVNQVSNDNVHQSVETVFSDKNIHSLLNATREKVGDFFLNMCSIFQNNSYDSTSKCIARSFPQGHQSKWVPRLSMVWPH